MVLEPTAEQRYRSLVENLPGSVVILFDRDLRFVLVDGPEVSATGFSKAEMEGKTLHDAVPAEFAAAVEANMRRVLDGERFAADIPFEDRFYHYEYVPIRAEGAVQFGLIVGQNVTERVRSDELHQRLQQQLQQAGKLDALGRLAGGVAHDFNNLLTAIHGYSSLLLRGAQAGTQVHADLLEIQRAAERGTTLTSQLLAFSHKHVHEQVPVDLNDVVAGTLRLLQRLLGEDVEVVFEPSRPLGMVRLDPGQLEQVLMNLAVNARDAMKGGGRLTIATRAVDLGADFCAGRPGAKPGPYVCLTVKDTGEGMPPELLEHVFEPFFTTKPRGQGTGLGLSIVYGIIRGADGFVEVSSKLGVGTTFELYVPCITEGDAVTADASPVPERTSGKPLTVLLVEDEPAVLAVTARMLRTHGHVVYEAAHVDQAVAFATDGSLRIDVLVTDVIMPALNGRELHERLCVHRPDLPVVFISGYTDDVIAGRLAGRRGPFLQKPFTPAQLLDVLEEAVAGSAPRTTARESVTK